MADDTPPHAYLGALKKAYTRMTANMMDIEATYAIGAPMKPILQTGGPWIRKKLSAMLQGVAIQTDRSCPVLQPTLNR